MTNLLTFSRERNPVFVTTQGFVSLAGQSTTGSDTTRENGINRFVSQIPCTSDCNCWSWGFWLVKSRYAAICQVYLWPSNNRSLRFPPSTPSWRNFKNVVFTLKMHQNDQFSSTTTGEILAGKPHGYRFRKAPFSCQISVDVRPDLRCCVDGA